MSAGCRPDDFTRYYQLRQAADPYRGYNCSAYVLAAGMDFDSCGTILTTGRIVRAMSDEPVPDPRSPGLRHEQLAAVALRFGVRLQVFRGVPWRDVMEASDDGYGVALATNYRPVRTSPYSGQPSFTGNHEFLLMPGRFTLDPLADGRVSGGKRVFHGPATYPEALLKAAAGDLILEYNANGSVKRRLGFGLAYAAIFPHRHPLVPDAPDTGGLVVVPNAPAPAERNVMITTTIGAHTFRLPKGQPLFRHPGGPVVTKTSKAGSWPWVGGAGAGWTAVRVMTGAPYADGDTRPTIVYVPSKAGVRE